MRFKGTIIITDPCYIDTKENTLWCDTTGKFDIFTGIGLEHFGFTTYLYRDTIYGDWSCMTFPIKDSSKDKNSSDITLKDIDGNRPVLGNFCADAGLVGVFLLDEVLRFNPTFDYHTTRPWTTTTIKDFDGEIEIEAVSIQGGDPEVVVRGRGNINFITKQTGL